MPSVPDRIARFPVTEMAVRSLEKELLALPQVECPVIHRFAPGLYIREVSIPAGTFSVGHRQKREHLNVMLKGSVTMLREDGTTELLQAPQMYTGKPGRKMGWIHEDMVWLNIYATNETDVEKLEEMFLDKSPYSMEQETLRVVSGYGDHEADRADYLAALNELGVSPETARAESEREYDRIAFPAGSYKCRVADSPIEGKGLFATADIVIGEAIALARISGKRTPAGRYTNHGINPNAKMVFLPDGNVILVATKEIKGSRGGQLGDEITIDYRQTYRDNRGE